MYLDFLRQFSSFVSSLLQREPWVACFTSGLRATRLEHALREHSKATGASRSAGKRNNFSYPPSWHLRKLTAAFSLAASDRQTDVTFSLPHSPLPLVLQSECRRRALPIWLNFRRISKRTTQQTHARAMSASASTHISELDHLRNVVRTLITKLPSQSEIVKKLNEVVHLGNSEWISLGRLHPVMEDSKTSPHSWKEYLVDAVSAAQADPTNVSLQALLLRSRTS